MSENLEKLASANGLDEEEVKVDLTVEDVWPKVIQLNKPVALKDGGPVVTELSISEPVAENFLGLPVDKPYDATIVLAHRLSGQPLNVIRKLRYADWLQVSRVVLPLVAGSLGIGRTS